MEQDCHHCTEQNLGKNGRSFQNVSKQDCFLLEKAIKRFVNPKVKAVLQLQSGILKPVNTQHVI